MRCSDRPLRSSRADRCAPRRSHRAARNPPSSRGVDRGWRPASVSTASGDALARIRTVRAVVNPLSGSVEAGAAEALRSPPFRALGRGPHVAEVQPAGDRSPSCRAAVDAAPDLLILLAGDGTIRMAASLAGADGPLLAPLPGGTMNMLPHAIYGAVPWRTALEQALETGVERDISGGEVDGRRFFVAAILGAPGAVGAGAGGHAAGQAAARLSAGLSRLQACLLQQAALLARRRAAPEGRGADPDVPAGLPRPGA